MKALTCVIMQVAPSMQYSLKISGSFLFWALRATGTSGFSTSEIITVAKLKTGLV
jgi:hypothetical protein